MKWMFGSLSLVVLAGVVTTTLFHQVNDQFQFVAINDVTWWPPNPAEEEQKPLALDASFPFLKKIQGDGWHMWDGKSILFEDAGFGPCRWIPYKVPASSSHNDIASSPPQNGASDPEKTTSICVHPNKDYVSDKIARFQRWKDCSILGELWNDYLAKDKPMGGNKTYVHVEVGANIGSCVVDLLLTLPTHVKLVLFEPNPRNLLRLTSTLLRMSNSTDLSQLHNMLEDRIRLFPIGLGSCPARDMIYGASHNLGHSVVGQVIQQSEGEPFEEGLPIFIERLDDILATTTIDSIETTHGNRIDYALMKLDAQGYECSIVDGMHQFLDLVETVSFESDGVLLKSFNCSAQHLWNSFLDGHNMTITDRQFRNKGRAAPVVRPGQRGTRGVLELLAVRRQIHT